MAHFTVYNTSDATRSDAPIAGSTTATIDTIQTQQEGIITGTAITDQPGNVLIDHSFDGTHWDYTDPVAVTANVGAKINLSVIAPFTRIRFQNTSVTGQTFIRLFVRTFGTKIG